MKTVFLRVLSVALCMIMIASVFTGCTVSGINDLWDDAYADEQSGFADQGAVKNLSLYVDGSPSTDYAVSAAKSDVRFMMENGQSTRIVNRPNGYAVTLPYTGVEMDNTLGAYKTVYSGEGYQVTVSYEDKSPYGNYESGWEIYLNEWLVRFVANDSFLRANNLSRTREVIENSKTILEGYTVNVYDIEINDPGSIDLPYYHIAIIRESKTYDRFYLLSMKTAEESTDLFDDILASFSPLAQVGTAVSTIDQYEVVIPEYWSKETRTYYEKLLSNMGSSATDWGFYTNSLAAKSESNYRSNRMNLKSNIKWIQSEDGIDTNMQILPTYLHLGYGTTKLSFPLDLAKECAGGNGTNGKPVIQVSYQFTTSNNCNLEGESPMFGILRGEYDEQFRSIAADIKAYGKPVLFRLNNEMNSDWTSYCGMVTLIDPDLFIQCWRRMYDIFVEEGVDNTIWIFNPIAKSCPYSNWGDTLCYMPGVEYMQVLGLTSYEMGNSLPLKSFEQHYQELYDFNKEHFADYPMIIGEFACGAGGDSDGRELGRYAEQRTQWVTEMFDCLKNKGQEGYAYCSNIVGIVWFDVNDYAGYDYLNYLEVPHDETATWAAFRNGLKEINGTAAQ